MAGPDHSNRTQSELNQDRILTEAEVYKEKYPEEKEMVEELPEAFKRGTWGRDEIEWIVVEWKLESFPKEFSDFPDNKVEDVRTAIDEVLNTDSVRKKIEAFTENDDISGVGIAVATAILVFIDPERFTVIDQHAWQALRAFGYVDEPYDSPSIIDYLVYLGICRTLAVEYDVDLRDLDWALWIIGRDL